MKKIFRIIAAMLVASLLGTTGIVLAADNQLRVATQPIPGYAPIFIAKHKKWLDEELAKTGSKASVKWTSFAAGPPMNESFAAGQQDIGLLGDTPAIIAKSVGINTRLIGLTSSGPKSLAVIVPAKSAIRTPKDLKGKKVAVVKGSYAHHLLVLVLNKGGLTTSDIKFINMSQADIVTSIQNGNIDAAAVWEPVITKLENQGTARVLADGTGIKKGVLLIAATNDIATKKREQARAFLRAYQRGAQFIKANPREAARLISGDVNLPTDLLVKVLAKYDFHPAIQADDIVELKKSETFMYGAGIIKSHVAIDGFVDVKLAKESGIK